MQNIFVIEYARNAFLPLLSIDYIVTIYAPFIGDIDLQPSMNISVI